MSPSNFFPGQCECEQRYSSGWLLDWFAFFSLGGTWAHEMEKDDGQAESHQSAILCKGGVLNHSHMITKKIQFPGRLQWGSQHPGFLNSKTSKPLLS